MIYRCSATWEHELFGKVTNSDYVNAETKEEAEKIFLKILKETKTEDIDKAKIEIKYNAITEIRYTYKLTQEELSKATGVPINTIRNWEQGQRECKSYIVNLIKYKLEQTRG